MLKTSALLLSTLLIAACGRDSGDDGDHAPEPEPATEQAPATPTGPSETAPTTEQPGGFGPRAPRPAPTPEPEPVTGVPACDRFLADYQACLEHVPEEARGGMQAALDAWRASWHTMSLNPISREHLVGTCNSTAHNSRAALARYDCPRSEPGR